MANEEIASPPPPPDYGSDKEAGNIANLRSSSSSSSGKGYSTHRNLKSRHIQLIGIGGTIGTALYVRIQERKRQHPSSPPLLFFTSDRCFFGSGVFVILSPVKKNK